ncbi:hypothetical protein DICVIV_04520 [Dictyocaulus viviparus]|uniref:Store-operated calcium entry-associated regulatory factor n=1 Tax=Dictyocaulus viviparus TaxID=29172 RepID=A0A0D8XZL6_DICVI|nr:hypothetical protein DICVIV_04520 [Dictyocaulus viviparus]
MRSVTGVISFCFVLFLFAYGGKRVAPVPQLRCVGGGACQRFTPRVVQCVKQGFDGFDYQWKCTADMPHQYGFGRITVTCEGFDYPEDPYILRGSCGLEYELEYTEATKDIGRRKVGSSWFSWLTFENIANAIVVLFILYVLYSMLSNSGSDGRRTPRYGWFGNGFDGGPGYGGGYPGMHPRPSAPPSYDDAMGFKNTYTASTSTSGPGFWTGAGLGALGGYLFGRNANTSSYGFRQMDEHVLRRSAPEYSDENEPTSSGLRESTGFGGTRRR